MTIQGIDVATQRWASYGVLVASLIVLASWPAAAWGQRGGRPSLGRVGVGGAAPRPNMGGGGYGRGGAVRPNINVSARPQPGYRPPAGQISRPSFGNAGAVSRPRPTPGGGGGMTRPGSNLGAGNLAGGNWVGANRPSLGGPGGIPNFTLPSSRPSNPGVGNRPGGTRPLPGNTSPGMTRPGATRPGITSPGNTLPGGGATTLPGSVQPGNRLPPGSLTRPGQNRPSADPPSLGSIQRPTPLPGTVRPGNRPGGTGNRPSIGRPTPLPGQVVGRPGSNGNRPPRPIGPQRPVTRPYPPPNHVNRPAWDRPQYNRPDWGWGNHQDWHHHWHDHCINHHYHHWYNGCWTGYWGSAWYAPVYWGGVGWGLNSWVSGWGYPTTYVNPYYSSSLASPAIYNYSQPVVVNNYSEIPSNGPTDNSAPANDGSSQERAALAAFDQGLQLFKAGRYSQALARFDTALQSMPSDPVVHETRALTFFALGKYADSAAILNALLTSAPGMDWTTLSGLYGKLEQYTAQFRRLQQHCVAQRTDAAAHFVLAYHHLVRGEKDQAIEALQIVVKQQPQDVTARRMLDALKEQSPDGAPLAAVAAEADLENAVPADAPQTDLVGTWQATAGDSRIVLTVTDDSHFTWTAYSAAKNSQPAQEAAQKTAELRGELISDGTAISLETTDQGTMAGSVTALSNDQWRFQLTGAPSGDAGLLFERKKP